MMPEVFVAHVFVGAIGSTAEPAQYTAESSVVTLAFEHEIVAAFMNQVGGNCHRVCQQKRRDQVDGPKRAKQADNSEHIGANDIQESDAVVS